MQGTIGSQEDDRATLLPFFCQSIGEPVQVFFTACCDRHSYYFRCLVGMYLLKCDFKLAVEVFPGLDQTQPFLCCLNTSVPPIRADHRPHDLYASGYPVFHQSIGDSVGIFALVGCGKDLDVFGHWRFLISWVQYLSITAIHHLVDVSHVFISDTPLQLVQCQLLRALGYTLLEGLLPPFLTNHIVSLLPTVRLEFNKVARGRERADRIADN